MKNVVRDYLGYDEDEDYAPNVGKRNFIRMKKQQKAKSNEQGKSEKKSGGSR